MKTTKRILGILLALCLSFSLTTTAFASSFTDAHGNVIELDDTLEAYNTVALSGADNAARKQETNLGDLWTDALRWFAVSGKINDYFEEDDVTAGNNEIAVDADHIVALWNGGNLRADIAVGKFGAAELAAVLPYPNKAAVVYMTGAQLLEALEAASQALPCRASSADACASFMQVSGLKYSVDMDKAYDAGEAYGKLWYKANSVNRVAISEVNGKAFEADATYAVVTSNANFNGMDSSYMFKEAAAANEKSTITTAVVRDIVWMYIDEVLENVVGDDYAAAQDRISITGSVFTDVKTGEYYADAVAWAVKQGVTAGATETTFAPYDTCTRAQTVTFLWRAAGSPAPAAKENPFTDVKEGAYYYDAVLWAVENGITGGTSATTFSPNTTVTRAQVVTFLYRAAKSPAVTGESAFTDVASDAYYEDAVVWAVENEITDGVNETSFAPAQSCTRAQIVTFLFRSYK